MILELVHPQDTQEEEVRESIFMGVGFIVRPVFVTHLLTSKDRSADPQLGMRTCRDIVALALELGKLDRMLSFPSRLRVATKKNRQT